MPRRYRVSCPGVASVGLVTDEHALFHFCERTPVLRTHLAGSLRSEHVDRTVTLTGWVARRRDHGGVIFIDLRDASGVAQVVFREGDVAEKAHRLRAEYVVKVTGKVEGRPEGNQNYEIPTGAVEVDATDIEVLSESAPLPFQLDDQPGGSEAEVPLLGPASGRPRSCDPAAIAGQCGGAWCPGASRVRRGGNTDADAVDARRCPRLPGPVSYTHLTLPTKRIV